ncbi:MAG: hypothetical protein IJ033_02190 [Clostridia bacterium]|nr:hypothetical protein [Clostridia bacterium]
MKKKVIALIMIIPLIFLITLFSVGEVASILADIPVSGIKITTQTDEGFIYLDMARYNADPDNFIYMQAQVEPSNAKNQNYSFRVESAEEGVEPADIEIDSESGLLTLNGTGKAKVTAVSADNGFTDSVVVNVRSSKVVSLEPKLSRLTGGNITLDKIGENEYSATLIPEDYQFSAAIYPVEVSDSSVTWTSSDENVITINSVTGRATTRLSGEATLTLDCDNAVEGFEPITIKVTVPYNGGESGIVIEGKSEKEMTYNVGQNVISFLVELEEANLNFGASEKLVISGANSSYVVADSYEALDLQGKRFKVTLTLSEGHPAKLDLDLTLPSKMQSSKLVAVFQEFSFNVFTSAHLGLEDDVYQKKDATIKFAAVGVPSDENVIYEWYAQDSALNIKTYANSSIVDLSSASVGTYRLVISAFEKLEGDERGELVKSITKTIHVVRGVYSVEFVTSMGSSDMEGLLTLGDTVMDAANAYKENYRPTLNMKVAYDDDTTGGYSMEDLEFSISDESIVKPYATTENFKIDVLADGIVTITAKWKNGVHFNQDIKTTLKIRGVNGGVMVGAESDDNLRNYRALKRASSEGRKVILMKDVMLGWSKMTETELKAEAYTMLTDYDWTYYANLNKNYPDNNPVARPSVYYLIEFRNDVYGNGHTVNADNFTMAKDSTGNPLLFKGPLNFVAIATASVKAQDNIVYLVREKGVDINNINLKGCSDSSLMADSGGMDLTKLNYAGTTLEISGDTNLTNSRVSNGRTVIRIFGGEVLNEGTANATTKVTAASEVNVSEHRLKARIESCIITNAREFLVKIGSNLSIFNESDVNGFVYNPKPFTNASGSAYTLYNHANASNDYFYNNYVITDVTLKNSVLATSGLFTIGMETHFAGNMLGTLSPDWYGCGGTSYASVLKMEGQVKMYDWKELSKVDSSTLIETTNAANEYLTLRIDKMLQKVVDVRNFTDIVSIIDGKEYVHGGIAMYGGGRNYSCIDTTNLESEKMTEYMVNIRDLAKNPAADGSDKLFVQQGENLPAAAGENDFAFYMYDASSNFNYQQQQAEINSGSAYIIPIAPVN